MSIPWYDRKYPTSIQLELWLMRALEKRAEELGCSRSYLVHSLCAAPFNKKDRQEMIEQLKEEI